MKPYFGITGIVSTADVDIIRECSSFVPSSHLMMAGVLVSGKTIKGTVVTNRRYPVLNQAIRRIQELSGIPNVFPTIHYNTGGSQDSLWVQLRNLLVTFEGFQGGVQLNVVAPDPSTIKLTRQMFPNVRIILQVNGSSVRSRTAEAVAAYVSRYVGLFDYALIDFSGGRGQETSVDLWYEILHNLEPMAQTNGFGLGVAGGLGPNGGDIIRDLRSRGSLALFSTDVESKTRVPVDNPLFGEKYQDRLDRDSSLAYVRSVSSAFT